MTVESKSILEMARGETNTIRLDWGENTQGAETGGTLIDGDTVASCTVSVYDKPTGAADLTLGSVTVGSTTKIFAGRRTVSAGEWTYGNVTTASNQTAGSYTLKYVATTTAGKVIPWYQRLRVIVPSTQ